MTINQFSLAVSEAPNYSDPDAYARPDAHSVCGDERICC